MLSCLPFSIVVFASIPWSACIAKLKKICHKKLFYFTLSGLPYSSFPVDLLWFNCGGVPEIEEAVGQLPRSAYHLIVSLQLLLMETIKSRHSNDFKWWFCTKVVSIYPFLCGMTAWRVGKFETSQRVQCAREVSLYVVRGEPSNLQYVQRRQRQGRKGRIVFCACDDLLAVRSLTYTTQKDTGWAIFASLLVVQP